MKLGVSVNAGHFSDMKECARSAEEAGLDLLAHPDSQAIDRALYPILAVSAEHSDTITISAVATNPVTRHPTVTASAIATVDEISEGRAVVCLAVGDSAVRNTEQQPASLDTLIDSVQAIRELLEEGQTQWNGGTSNLNWGPRSSIPVYMAATGPRTLAAGGRVADGVVFGGHPDRIEWAIEHVESGAVEAGRDPENIEFWIATPGEVADSHQEAIDTLRHTLAAWLHIRAQGSLNDVPDEIAERIKRVAKEYRSDLHNTFDNPHNADLIDKYDLREYVSDRPIAGRPSQVVEQIKDFKARGVDGAVLLLRHNHPNRTIERLGEEVVPNLP